MSIIGLRFCNAHAYLNISNYKVCVFEREQRTRMCLQGEFLCILVY